MYATDVAPDFISAVIDAVLADDTRDILGLWIENTEGAKFWMKVFNDLKTRGVHDILIAVTDTHSRRRVEVLDILSLEVLRPTSGPSHARRGSRADP